MKKIDLGQTFGIIANLGVIAGILLLVFELNQNRTLIAAQTRDSISQSVVSKLGESAGNSVLADIVRRADVGEELTPTEQYQYTAYMISWFRVWENQHYQYRVGLYDETEFAAVRRVWVSRLQREDAGRELWCALQGEFSPAFSADVNGALGESRCE